MVITCLTQSFPDCSKDGHRVSHKILNHIFIPMLTNRPSTFEGIEKFVFRIAIVYSFDRCHKLSRRKVGGFQGQLLGSWDCERECSLELCRVVPVICRDHRFGHVKLLRPVWSTLVGARAKALFTPLHSRTRVVQQTQIVGSSHILMFECSIYTP